MNLDIDQKDFDMLKTDTKLSILFGNVKEMKSMIAGWQEKEDKQKFHLKIQYAWLAAITGVGTWIVQKFVFK